MSINRNKQQTPLYVDIIFFDNVTRIITQHISEPNLTPAFIAKQMKLSVSQLNRKINAITGYSTNNYIIQLKVNHAKKQLVNLDKSIGEIAKDCGFLDLAYFSRTFKKHTGVTPTFYRSIFMRYE